MDYILTGKMVLAIMSFPLWEISIVGTFLFIQNKNVIIGQMDSGKYITERVPFIPRLYAYIFSLTNGLVAFAMCYPILSYLDWLKRG